MRTEYIKWTLLICLITSTFVTPSAEAQRRTKEKGKAPENTEKTAFRIEEESLAAEGMKFIMKDEPDRAIPIFEKLVQTSSADPASHYLLATALVKLEKFDDAIASAKKAYDLDKENIYYAQQLAELYAKRRKYPEAAEIYEKMLAKNPGNVQYGVELAAVYVFNDQFDKAINTYNVLEKSLGVTEEITHQKEQLYLRQNNLE